MSSLHPVLDRQLKRAGLTDFSEAPSTSSWQQLLERISQTYTQAEQDRYLLERSLSVSSEEMQQEIMRRKETEMALQQAHEDLSAQNQRLERVNMLFQVMLEQLTETIQHGASSEELLNTLQVLETQFDHLEQQRNQEPVNAEFEALISRVTVHS